MRRKKHKNTRRAVKFYRMHYKFREPFKVLLDGNFVHVTQLANLTDLDDHVAKLLGSNCKLFTTPCVMHELKSLGKEYSTARSAARRQALHKCGHDTPISAADCLLQQVGRNNSNHWWIATQDATLKDCLQKIPGCPCVFASVNGLHLDVPSELEKSLAKEEEVRNSGVQEHERKSEALRDLDELSKHKGKNIFRRKKAKGPNPLAVKKKSTKLTAQKQQPSASHKGSTSAGASDGAGGSGVGSESAAPFDVAGKTHKRKRKKKSTAAAGAAAVALAGD